MFKTMARTAAAIGVAGSAMLAGPQAAQAAPTSAGAAVRADAPPCYDMAWNTTSRRVWCDGHGPTRYQLILACTRNMAARGNAPWLGDRRGSYAKCPSGTTVVDYFIRITE